MKNQAFSYLSNNIYKLVISSASCLCRGLLQEGKGLTVRFRHGCERDGKTFIMWKSVVNSSELGHSTESNTQKRLKNYSLRCLSHTLSVKPKLEVASPNLADWSNYQVAFSFFSLSKNTLLTRSVLVGVKVCHLLLLLFFLKRGENVWNCTNVLHLGYETACPRN